MSRRSQGFTLSEVLIALALLGIVAAFAIPKVLQSTSERQTVALGKEAFGALSTAIYDARLNNQANTHAQLRDYFVQHLNTLRTCPTDYYAEGCYLDAGVSPSARGTGFVLPNGVVIYDFDLYSVNCTQNPCGDIVMIDTNGTKPPNRFGQDSISIVMSFGKGAYQPTGVPADFEMVKSGGIYPYKQLSVSSGNNGDGSPISATDVTNHTRLLERMFQQ